MGSAIAYGYRMNERGRVVHRYFDLHDLQHGEASRNGWVDSPDKVPGFAAAEVNSASRKASHAHTTGREPKPTGVVYGDIPKVDIPKAAPKPASPKPQQASGTKFVQTPKGQRAMSTKTGRFVKA